MDGFLLVNVNNRNFKFSLIMIASTNLNRTCLLSTKLLKSGPEIIIVFKILFR